MNYKLGFILILFGFMSCKKSEKPSVNEIKNVPSDKIEINKFEQSLLDLKDINVKFNDSFQINRFGALKKNDSIYAFVFRLNDNITENLVNKYSIGLRAYSFELGDKVNHFKSNFTPNLTKKQGGKYIILKQKINNIRYFDSIEAYIYKRRNWNASGRLGTIIIKDILLEEKNK